MPLTSRKQTSSSYSHSNCDPLLGILVGTIGIMLVAVLFTVLSAGAKMVVSNLTVTIYAPILRAAQTAERRELILCQHGRIAAFEIGRVTDNIDAELHRSADPVQGARAMNARVIKDKYFEYTVKLIASPQQLIQVKNAMPTITMVVQSLDNGEPISTFNSPASRMKSDLQAKAKSGAWLHFLVDGDSIDIFRAARSSIQGSGARIGWEPITVTFPDQECIVNCGEGGAGSGPQIIRGYQNTAR